MVRIIWLQMIQLEEIERLCSDYHTPDRVQAALHDIAYNHITHNIDAYATVRSVALLYDTKPAMSKSSALVTLFPPCFTYEGIVVSTSKIQNAMQSLDALAGTTHCGACYLVMIDSTGSLVSRMASEQIGWFKEGGNNNNNDEEDSRVLLVTTTVAPPSLMRERVHFEAVPAASTTHRVDSISQAELMKFGSLCRDMSTYWQQFSVASEE